MRTAAAIMIAALAFLAACEEQSAEPREPNAINEGAGSRLGNASPALRNLEIRSRFQSVGQAIELYRTNRGDLPATLNDLLPEGAVTEGMLVDPWEQPLRYEIIDGKYRLWSVGEDGENGTDDDIEYEDSSYRTQATQPD